ncbi:MAG: hypothetical protein CMJ85_10010 [Planctomycetes bacterium]|nr:hypothetical protein [Planctomycetota bacterium]MDP6423488.1 EboA domain-containing protein [Planctomycetota bacterium]
MFDLEGQLPADWLDEARQRLRDGGENALRVLFPGLARSVGRDALDGGIQEREGLKVNFAAWRVCDAAGSALIEAAETSDETIVDLFLHGDFEERTIVMRSLAVADVGPATVELLGEAQRTNTQTHFEACVCDSNLVARAVGQRDFKTNDAYKTLLKGAFVGLPLDRFFGILDHASPELARMVEGLASERRAAGRAVWPDTDRVVAACGS